MKRIMIAPLFCALALMAACATASKPGAMVAELTESSIVAEGSKLRNAVTVAEVTGGKETNPLWTSKVSNEDFMEALRQTLSAHAMLANDTGTYMLTAELVKLKQPVLGGFDMSVTSDVKYVLKDVASGAVVMEETISHKHTATVGDAFIGVERLRLANEGSIKGNIGKLIEAMIAKVDATPAVAVAAVAAEPAAPVVAGVEQAVAQ